MTEAPPDRSHLQIRARMSPLPVANKLPVGLGATEMTITDQRSACVVQVGNDNDDEGIIDQRGGSRTGILVALKHQLGIPSTRVPELNPTVLGATENPLSVGGQGDAEYEILSSKKDQSR